MPNMRSEDYVAGENVTNDVRRDKPIGIVISVRLSQEDSDRLIDLADETGKTVSQVARQAIRSFVTQRGQRPTFVPEVTGNNRLLDIVTVAPLGTRTAGGPVRIDQEVPPIQTGYLAELG